MTDVSRSTSSAPRKTRGTKKQETRGERNINWIQEHCRIPEGKDVGKQVKLRDWQKANILKIYDNPHGTRRAIISFGRKNAKTTLAAFLLLLHLVGKEARPNSQLNSAAQSKDQAGILFRLAAKIVRMSGSLVGHVTVRDTIKELYCPLLGTTYKALSADATTAYGLSPAFIVHDELGQVKGPRSELYDALETAVGAHDEPLSVIISTQAPTDADLLSILIDDAARGDDPRVVLSLYTAPQELDPFNEATIKLANPAFGDFLNATEVMAMAEDAKRMPARESEFRNLVLNQRVTVSSPFVTKMLWDKCGAIPKPLGDVPVFAGLDLSEVNDLTALVMVGQIDGIWQVYPTFWLPADGLRTKARQDRVPYDMWEQTGELLTVPGKSVSYEYVATHLRGLCTRHNVRKIAFDRWNYRHLKPWLLKAGFTATEVGDMKDDEASALFVPFGQGYQSMSPALRTLSEVIANEQLAHGNHPVLAMCAANSVIAKDDAGNKKLTKSKSTGRIDGMVALMMAIGITPMESVPQKKEYQMVIL